jgi:hypothetical protein
MEVETKFLRLFKPVNVSDRIDGGRVCWVGGGTNAEWFSFVTVERRRPAERPTA